MEWRDILAPHWACSQPRLREQAVVLCIQDTTDLAISTAKPSAAGATHVRGAAGHVPAPHLCRDALRASLWGWDDWMWAREPKDANGERGGVKESIRWLEGYERVAELAAQCRPLVSSGRRFTQRAVERGQYPA